MHSPQIKVKVTWHGLHLRCMGLTHHRWVWGWQGGALPPQISTVPPRVVVLYVSTLWTLQHFASLCSADWVEGSGLHQSDHRLCWTSFYQRREIGICLLMPPSCPPHAPWSLKFKPSHVTHKEHRWMPKTDRIYHRWDFHPPHYPAVCGYINWPPAPSVDTFRTRKCQKKVATAKGQQLFVVWGLKT